MNNKLGFIDSLQILRSPLESLVKNIGKYYFKYLSKKTDNKVLDLIK